MLNKAVLVGSYVESDIFGVIKLDLGEDNGFKNIVPIVVNSHFLQECLHNVKKGDVIGVNCKVKSNPIDFNTVYLEAEKISILSRKDL